MKTTRGTRTAGGNGFTLMELLVVMAIIAILAGVMFPAIKKVIEISYGRKTEQTARQLVTAISTYQTEYRRYPLGNKPSNRSDVIVETDEALMNILLAQENNPDNPRGKVYFNGRNASGRPPRDGVVFNSDGGGRLYDHWGNYYRVLMDTDNNERVEPPFKKQQMSGANIVAKGIAIWSLGPDGEESGEGAKDNIVTW